MSLVQLNIDEPIIVVTGLPRSGTSLMMQMLQAGGIPILTDEKRVPDTDNPRGYFEYEKSMWLAADSSWMESARGKAVKVIVQLLPYIPVNLEYRVVMMNREMAEVTASQATMLRNLGSEKTIPADQLRLAYAQNLVTAKKFLDHLARAKSATFEYRQLISAPSVECQRLAHFLTEWNLNCSAMAGVVDPRLYRSRV